jgi:hypothetical protein
MLTRVHELNAAKLQVQSLWKENLHQFGKSGMVVGTL